SDVCALFGRRHHLQLGGDVLDLVLPVQGVRAVSLANHRTNHRRRFHRQFGWPPIVERRQVLLCTGEGRRREKTTFVCHIGGVGGASGVILVSAAAVPRVLLTGSATARPRSSVCTCRWPARFGVSSGR